MQVTWEMRDGRLYLYLAGELDHHAAHLTLEQIGKAVEDYLPLHCVMDLSNLTFMDSSGIAVILGTNRRLQSYGGDLVVAHVPRQPAKVLTTAGVDRLVPVSIAQ